jgi:hypothetical protein
MLQPSTLYETVARLGIEHDGHESDLYLPVTEQTTALIDAYEFKANVSVFKDCGELWYEVPFAFMPWWNAKGRS